MTSSDCSRCPKDAANYFAKIRNYNYLAHTIREMEREIYVMSGQKRLNYHITIHVGRRTNYTSTTNFYKKGCTIFLPDDCMDVGNKDIRLILAHELGHIAYNIKDIENISGFNDPDIEEEYYAWRFAYHLLKTRSDDFRHGIGIREYIYQPGDLDTNLMRMVNRFQPDVSNRVREYLGGQSQGRP